MTPPTETAAAERALVARLPGCAHLPAPTLDALRDAARPVDLAPGATLLSLGQPAPDWYAIVVTGALEVAHEPRAGAPPLETLESGEVLDVGPPGEPAGWSVVASGPTRCLLVPRAAVAERRGRLLAAPLDASRGELMLFAGRAGDLVEGPAATCPPDLAVAEAAGRMVAAGIGSLVIVGPDGAPRGIVTDRDLRARVVAPGRPPGTPVGEVMSAPLVTIAARAPAWEALLEMTRRGIRHLGVETDGRLLGVISTHDFVRLQGGHPVALARAIEAVASVEALTAAARRIPVVTRWLVGGGATMAQVGRIVAELNDRLVGRAVALAEAALGAEGRGGPPVAYSWLAAGSEGRREQTLRTDQDNGLVYEAPPGAAPEVAAWFALLARRVGETLARLGFPPCDGGFMATNPRWCQPSAAWRADFGRWMETPTPEHVVQASVFLDLRPVVGADGPGRALREWVSAAAPAHVLFLRHLARDAVERRPPLGLFGGFIVERSGVHKDRLDLKARGIFPITQAARVHGLAVGAVDTGTLDRLAAAAGHGALTPGELGDVHDAWEVLGRLRLRHQLACLDEGRPADNHVDPAALGRADRLLLKDAFRVVEWLQRSVADRFQTATVT